MCCTTKLLHKHLYQTDALDDTYEMENIELNRKNKINVEQTLLQRLKDKLLKIICIK